MRLTEMAAFLDSIARLDDVIYSDVEDVVYDADEQTLLVCLPTLRVTFVIVEQHFEDDPAALAHPMAGLYESLHPDSQAGQTSS